MILTSASISVAPTLTVGATTNFNQNSAVLNAVVNTTGNRNITLVEFQYSTSASFVSGNSSWVTASTNSTITQGANGTACTYNATGLTASVEGIPSTYFVRFRVTNSSGFVTTSSVGGSFNTYRERTDPFTSSGTWNNPVPTSGTSGLAIDTFTQIISVGGGGAGTTGGGGGGTFSIYTNIYVPGVTAVPVTIGGGGAGSSGADGSPTNFGYFGGSGGQSGRDYFRDGFECFGGSSNGFSGGNYAAGVYAFSINGGGGAGLGGNGGNASELFCGNGGPAGVFGFCGGGGGGGNSGATRGTPNGHGITNRGTGGAAVSFIPNGFNGGSGYCNVTYWGPY
jgi:hypothetical protein